MSVHGLTKAFAGVPALDGVSLSLEAGTVHALLGGNGSGKSTTIKILAGVCQADAGTVSIGDRRFEAADLTPSAVREAGLRFVHQQPSTFADLTVAENLWIGHRSGRSAVRPIAWRALNAAAARTLERFRVRASPGDRVGDLSLATQTMVAIARALQDVDEADGGILVLDEPTAALPPAEVDNLLDDLLEFARGGQTILYVTHRLEEVVHVADAATVLRDGSVAATVGADAGQDQLVELITGRKLDRFVSRPTRDRAGRPSLVVDGLVAGSVRGVDLELRPGEIVGVAGLLGTGRSTLLRALFGLLNVEAGTVTLDGRPYAAASPAAAMREGFAYVPEDRARDAAFSDLTVTENIGMTVTTAYFARGRLRHRRERADTARLLEDYLVKAASEDVPLATLSGGNQQKVILARWLRRSPRVLLLDEPTQGVDIGARAEIWELIRRAVDGGAAALVVSSDFEELARVSDRALVMRGGRVIAELAREDLDAHRLQQALLTAGQD
ncbi:sugar ABC transporter ATP-binding protein [Baekduia sp.]|uniref:sugar ABC transporter ATP-binding protein n=1 Tax=Baekduia sp. TaxID=2600305 RepID=UPI002D7733B0|nr:sugar ABC transporter ATP-binding protein [Baekduia sp.]